MSEREVSAFVDRVMTAIEAVPPPTPVRNFGWSLRARAWRDATSSLVVAWHLGTVRTWPVAPRVRARSIALVLAVASVLATGSIVAAAAVRVAVPDGDPVPPVAAPATTLSSTPIVDGPGVDDSDQDLIRVSPSRPVQPGAAESEPTAGPSHASGGEPKDPANRAGGTTRSSADAADDSHVGTGSHDDSDDASAGSDRMDDGDGGHGDTDRHDGSGDSDHDGSGSDGGGDSSDGGRD